MFGAVYFGQMYPGGYPAPSFQSAWARTVNVLLQSGGTLMIFLVSMTGIL